MILAVTNLKGGVGKTTLTTNIAVGFAHRGYNVCIVDTDLGQQSSMEWGGNRDENLPKVPVYGIQAKQLNKDVAELEKRFDLVVIDGTPQIDEIADRTILASDILIIPLTPSLYDFRGFERFLERYEKIKDTKAEIGRRVEAYVLMNRVNETANVTKEIEQALASYDVKKLESKIVHRVAYVDSASEGKGVTEYRDPKAKAEIEKLVDELLVLMTNFK